MTFHEACRRVLADAKANPYAKAYASAGLDLSGNAARVQALYILSNLSSWRSPMAKEVRAVLKTVGEVK